MADGQPQADDSELVRARTYALLGALLAGPPGSARLDELAGAEVDASAGPVAAAWDELARAARDASEEEVDDEYHDLFIGLGRGELMPFASWYLTGFLMGRPLVSLRSDLAALGFERQADVHEPEDHAAALFDVMAALADPGQGESITTQQRFFAEHLAPWIERFMSDLSGARSARFYRAVAMLGERFVVLEKQYLGLAEGGVRAGSAG